MNESSRLQSFLLGWSFGFGYFIVAFHWIGFAFLVDAEDYLWMMPFAVGGLAAAMAVYWGLATLLRSREPAEAASRGAGFCRVTCGV